MSSSSYSTSATHATEQEERKNQLRSLSSIKQKHPEAFRNRTVISEIPNRQTTPDRKVPSHEVAFGSTYDGRTPHKPGMHILIKDEGVFDSDIKRWVRNEFKENVLRNYPILDFVQSVWNYLPDDIPGDGYVIPGNLRSWYLKSGRYVKSGLENERYSEYAGEASASHCFQTLFRDLARIVQEKREEQDAAAAEAVRASRFPGVMRFLQDRPLVGKRAKLKPDFGYAALLERSEDPIAWEPLGLFGELKKTDKGVDRPPEEDIPICLSELLKKPKSTKKATHPSPPSVSSKGKKRAEPDTPLEQGPSSKQLKSGHIGSTNSSSASHRRLKPKGKATRKDNRKVQRAGDVISTPASKVERTSSRVSQTTAVSATADPAQQGQSLDSELEEIIMKIESREKSIKNLTGHEVQAAKYLNELLSHGARNYATGFLVENTKISLWYADRLGIMKSVQFDFLEEPHYLLLMVAAISSANDAALGFCPLIVDGPRDHIGYAGAKLRIPNARDVNNENIGTVELDLDADGEREILTAYGTVGRGTTVVPVTTSGRTRDLFGSDKLVVKMSWQPVNRREEGHIRHIRRTLANSDNQVARDALEFIVDLKCSVALQMNDPAVDFPRVCMDMPMPNDELRDFRMLALKEYLSLDFIDTAEELVQVFRDVITGHNWAWEIANVLHRDISISNVMFHRRDGRVIGVLCDWDLAETREFLGEDDATWVDEEELQSVNEMKIEGQQGQFIDLGDEQGQHDGTNVATQNDDGIDAADITARRRRAKYRTGTGPFMSLELLGPSEKTPTHLHRHDLESFFWVLAWFCATHDPVAHTSRRVGEWMHPKLSHVASAKQSFLSEETARKRVYGQKHSRYASLISGPLDRLRSAFNAVRLRIDVVKHQRNELMRALIDDNSEWIEECRESITMELRAVERLVSFRKFMQCLTL
ncbi:unnamed protein product [Somion occarium]|uniref:Fungal-type protein kinase domain-containing protein n=1 Tax=Somion occarium TaxID=3059160 RepID=A0ABP1DYB3_9APHY